ncbi:ABC transporter ATP-binding protein [Paenibacillus amylolyticus]|uniref:ABC transporter ATP-binding protein n=1 Tax=Paenibacillus TaxID=44249 RepID=UPI000FDAD59C|nr:ABC transporter ATP-binding protein [Paenibacillus amylolyticus]WFA84600.1 ABC transporter ATP-binding protein/permease [Paenibacillus amylolyticus]
MKKLYKSGCTFLLTVKEVIMTIYRYNRWIVIMGILFSLYFSVVSLTMVHTSKWLINSLNSADFKSCIQIFLLVTFLNLIKNIMNDYQQLKNEEFSFQISIFNQKRLIKGLDEYELYEKEHSDFQSKQNIATRGITMYFGYFRLSIQLIESLLISVSSLFFLVNYSIYLGLSVILISLFKLIIISKIINKKVDLNRELQQHQREPDYFYNLLIDVPVQKELKSYGITDYFLEKWNQANNKMYSIRKKLLVMQLKNNVSQNLFSQLSLAAVIVMIIILVSKQSLTVGDYFALTLALNLAESNITSLVRNITQGAEDTYYIDDFNKFVRPRRKSENGTTYPYQFRDGIDIKNLYFKYPNSTKNVLNDISFRIEKGQKLVILGENGSGKTTLLKLIGGLYSAPENTIFYDGTSQHLLDKSSLFKGITTVFQDFTKYMITVKENVILGNNSDHLNDELMLEAFNIASFKDYRNLPNGIDTRLGYLTSDSVNLSGGQWQKLALARALYKGADLLLLDEPTAAIDAESEVLYLENLFKEVNKTVVVITHRINIACLADYIIFMKDGNIVEAGSHELLLSNENGIYKRLWDRQSSPFQLEGREVAYG